MYLSSPKDSNNLHEVGTIVSGTYKIFNIVDEKGKESIMILAKLYMSLSKQEDAKSR